MIAQLEMTETRHTYEAILIVKLFKQLRPNVQDFRDPVDYFLKRFFSKSNTAEYCSLQFIRFRARNHEKKSCWIAYCAVHVLGKQLESTNNKNPLKSLWTQIDYCNRVQFAGDFTLSFSTSRNEYRWMRKKERQKHGVLMSRVLCRHIRVLERFQRSKLARNTRSIFRAFS